MKCLTFLVLMGLAGMALVGCGQTPTDSLGTTAANAPKPANRVVVYYMHRTFRCFSCLWIENTTRQTLKDTFPSELASGRLDFQVEDYMKREDLAKRYDVQTVSVVVVNVVDGREVSHQTLEKAWDLKLKNDEFRAYVNEAVRAALAKTK
jgi:hypothetical protein